MDVCDKLFIFLGLAFDEISVVPVFIKHEFQSFGQKFGIPELGFEGSAVLLKFLEVLRKIFRHSEPQVVNFLLELDDGFGYFLGILKEFVVFFSDFQFFVQAILAVFRVLGVQVLDVNLDLFYLKFGFRKPIVGHSSYESVYFVLLVIIFKFFLHNF